MSEPPRRPKELEFSRRSIILIVLAMIAAAALTVEGTYLILNAFVLHDPNDPLTKAGGFPPASIGGITGAVRPHLIGVSDRWGIDVP
jgi:hypothetical protein